MEKLKWQERIYALYKGEQFIAEGTIPEIHKETGKSIHFLRWMNTPAYNKRAAKGKKRLQIIKLDD